MSGATVEHLLEAWILATSIMAAAWCATAIYGIHMTFKTSKIAINCALPCDIGAVMAGLPDALGRISDITATIPLAAVGNTAFRRGHRSLHDEGAQ
jgi:hypothetical protein